jgi:hypothetical protein
MVPLPPGLCSAFPAGGEYAQFNRLRPRGKGAAEGAAPGKEKL